MAALYLAAGARMTRTMPINQNTQWTDVEDALLRELAKSNA
jgi:hypothetical protein